MGDQDAPSLSSSEESVGEAQVVPTPVSSASTTEVAAAATARKMPVASSTYQEPPTGVKGIVTLQGAVPYSGTTPLFTWDEEQACPGPVLLVSFKALTNEDGELAWSCDERRRPCLKYDFTVRYYNDEGSIEVIEVSTSWKQGDGAFTICNGVTWLPRDFCKRWHNTYNKRARRRLRLPAGGAREQRSELARLRMENEQQASRIEQQTSKIEQQASRIEQQASRIEQQESKIEQLRNDNEHMVAQQIAALDKLENRLAAQGYAEDFIQRSTQEVFGFSCHDALPLVQGITENIPHAGNAVLPEEHPDDTT